MAKKSSILLVVILFIGVIGIAFGQERQRWFDTKIMIDRDREQLEQDDWVAHFSTIANTSSLSRRAFFVDSGTLRHEIAHAWHYNIVKKEIRGPWDNCTGDLDCRIREKFDEYRDNGELSDLALEVWPNYVPSWQDSLACRASEEDPIPDIYHYAECNSDAFFSVISVIFMEANRTGGWPPWDRQGLYDLDTELFALMEDSWGMEYDMTESSVAEATLETAPPVPIVPSEKPDAVHH